LLPGDSLVEIGAISYTYALRVALTSLSVCEFCREDLQPCQKISRKQSAVEDS
jgi:hypothetical protein